MLELIFLGAGLILSVVAIRLGWSAGWHPVGIVLAGAVPIGFTFFMGLIGLVIGIVFVGAVYKAAE